MTIELIIGGIGALLITWLFVRRENNRKKLRGKTLTKTLLKESIIPLRYHVRQFLALLINETRTGRQTKTENLVQSWNHIQLWRNRISPLFAVSGDVINTDQQVILGKILEDLQMEFNFSHIEIDQASIHGLDKHCTDYLKMNKDFVKEVNNETKSMILERIANLSDSITGGSADILKQTWLNTIKENEEIIKDIIKD